MLLPEKFILPFELDIKKCTNGKFRKKKFSVIYMITSPDGKIYIGQGYDAEARICVAYLHGHCKKQKNIYESLKIHGYLNHKYEIIYVLPDDERNILTKKEVIDKLNILEIYYIELCKSYYFENKEIGLNLTKGGDNKEHSEETIKKISKGNKGKKRSPETIEKIRKSKIGVKQSEDTIRKKSEMFSGEGNPFYNKTHTNETKDILSKISKDRFSNPENHPMFNKHHTDETKKKLSDSHLGKYYGSDEDRKKKSDLWSNEGNPFYGSSRTGEQNPMFGKSHSKETITKISESNSIKVNQYSLDGEFIKTWSNSKIAGLELNIHPTSILKACKCKFKTGDGNIAKGFIWKYI